MKLIEKLSLKFEINNYFTIGNISFLLGIFLLPSALPLGALFLLLSIVISFFINKENFLKNRWNFTFFICLILIILSTIYSCLLNPSDSLLRFDRSIIWLNLFNWVPIYFFFIGSQIYLKSEKQRN